MEPRFTALAFLFLILLFPSLGAQDVEGDALLSHEFWCESEPHPASPGARLLSAQETTALLAAEAAWVYSGMIRGFRVSWTPRDLQRGVSEAISVQPIGAARTEAERVVVREAWTEGTTLHARVDYYPDAQEILLRDSWRNSSYPAAGGTGRAKEIDGPTARVEAMEDSIRAALESWARASLPNRPRRVLAVAAFEEPPLIDIDAGFYVARARVRLRIEDVRPYTVY